MKDISLNSVIALRLLLHMIVPPSNYFSNHGVRRK